MGTVIIKAAKDRDLYLEWSSVVEAPTLVGTREEILNHLNTPRPGQYWATPEENEARLARADANGSSGFPPFDDGAWNDSTLMYQQQGLLPRYHLATLADRIIAGDGKYEVADLLTPLDDDLDEEG